ncbi:DUF418 domain-containing protein [Nocardiopsis exhalans]|uniref:DUF418 domain-containing protein n=1 Tax=Nocardiopsis exhalans TaxID=163604 RepID=A0ABY5DCU3_9ACTN|nr:DUF418 domain-containing protein [Nocardiopsis exhalans]USY21847.1 DUF418 domain-containing protein [Nocardiopsis exhalans]
MRKQRRAPETGPAAAHRPSPALRPGRSLAPDLSRGFMLLFIALVNAQFFLTHSDTVRGLADQVLLLVQGTLVNGRAIPLFSLLFGYGAVWIMRRVIDSGGGWVHARVVLRRRGFWMLVIGLLHGVLLLPVDIIGAYGLGLLLFVGFLRVRDSVMLWSAAAFALASAALITALSLVDASSSPPGAEESAAAVPSLVETGFLAASSERFAEWTLYTPVTLLFVVMPPMLLGMWAGRRGILERPREHRTLLVRVAVLGLGIAVLAGLPDALVTARFLPEPGQVALISLWIVHDLAGWAGGPAWAALLALLAMHLTERAARRASAPDIGGADISPETAPLGPVTTAIAAAGERSMSCYLAQALVFTLVFAPYGLGLGATMSASAAALVAVLTWLLTVVLADVSRRFDLRGPAEVVLRELTYARTRLPSPPERRD